MLALLVVAAVGMSPPPASPRSFSQTSSLSSPEVSLPSEPALSAPPPPNDSGTVSGPQVQTAPAASTNGCTPSEVPTWYLAVAVSLWKMRMVLLASVGIALALCCCCGCCCILKRWCCPAHPRRDPYDRHFKSSPYGHREPPPPHNHPHHHGHQHHGIPPPPPWGRQWMSRSSSIFAPWSRQWSDRAMHPHHGRRAPQARDEECRL